MGRVVAPVFIVSLALVACYPCKQISSGDLCGDSHVDIPFKKIGWFPTVPAMVDGVPFNLLIDTGASTTFLSSTRAHKNRNEIGRDVEVRIGGMTLQLFYVWYINSPFSTPDDDNINGTIGTDVLFALDYQQTQTNIILSDEPLVCNGPTIRATKQYDTQIYLPLVTIDQRPVAPVLLDTGSSILLLSGETADLLPPYVQDTAQPSGYCVFEGCYTAGAFTTSLHEVCVGSVCETNVPAKYPGWDAVGQSWLQRHKSFIVSIYGRTLQICQ